MLKTWRDATSKHQFFAAICFVIAYFSPLVGIIIFLFMKFRNMDNLFRIAMLTGACAALLLYSIDSVFYLL